MACGKLFLIALFAISALVQAAPENKPATPEKPAVFVEKALRVPLFDLLSYPARVSPKVNATVLSEYEGVVTEIKAPLGTAVKKNQRIVTVKNTDPVYQFAPMSVRAPVAGIVSQVDITTGSRVVRGQKLASITDPSKVSVVVEISGADLPVVIPGLTGEMRVPGISEALPVRVAGVSPLVDPATGTATGELTLLSSAKLTLPPGAVGRVSFKVREHQGVQLPEHAVFYKGKDTFLRIVTEGKVKYVPVTLGNTRRGYVEVLDGVAEGSDIIVRTSAFVGEGEEVNSQTVETGRFD